MATAPDKKDQSDKVLDPSPKDKISLRSSLRLDMLSAIDRADGDGWSVVASNFAHMSAHAAMMGGAKDYFVHTDVHVHLQK